MAERKAASPDEAVLWYIEAARLTAGRIDPDRVGVPGRPGTPSAVMTTLAEVGGAIAALPEDGRALVLQRWSMVSTARRLARVCRSLRRDLRRLEPSSRRVLEERAAILAERVAELRRRSDALRKRRPYRQAMAQLAGALDGVRLP